MLRDKWGIKPGYYIVPFKEHNRSHALRSWKEFYREIIAGRKCHELRPDRGFRVGDVLYLAEVDKNTGDLTDRQCKVQVTYITSADVPCALSNKALDEKYVILSIALLTKNHI